MIVVVVVISSSSSIHGKRKQYSCEHGDLEKHVCNMKCSLMYLKTSCMELLEARGCSFNDPAMTMIGRSLRLGSYIRILHLENSFLSGRPLMLLGMMWPSSVIQQRSLCGGVGSVNCVQQSCVLLGLIICVFVLAGYLYNVYRFR